jgi:tetratricopeptide (TPR) repeat protein
MVAQCGSDLPDGVEGHKRFADGNDLPSLVAGVKEYISTLPPTPMGVPAQCKRAQGMPLPATRFVGRSDEMWKIHVSLQGDTTILAGSTNTAKGGHGLAQVLGCGGMGKTLLAAEYVSRFGTAWPGGVFWLNAGGPAGGDKHLQKLLEQLKLLMFSLALPENVVAFFQGFKDVQQEMIIAATRNRLSDLLPNDKNWLWIVDNFPLELKEKDARFWTAPPVKGDLGKTLITTRNQRLGGVGQKIDTKKLDPDAAYALLTARIPPNNKEEEGFAQALCTELGCHALSLDIAGALRELTFKTYRELALAIKETPAVVYNNDLSADLPGDYDDNILKTLRLSLDSCSPQALALLKMASCLAPGVPIPCSLLEDAGAGNPELLADLLRQTSLATLKEKELTLHAAVTHSVRLIYEDTNEYIPALVRALTKALEKAPTLGTLECQETITPYLPHIDDITTDPRTESEIKLLLLQGRALRQGGLFSPAEEAEERAYQAARAHLGADHFLTLASMNNLAETAWARGNFGKALISAEGALSGRRRILGPEHPDTLKSMGNVAAILWAQEKFSEARDLQEEALAVHRRTLGAEHPDTLSSMNNLAETLRAQKEFAEAHHLQEKILDVRRRVLGAEHPDTLSSMNNLASTLIAQDKITAARDLHEQTLLARRRVLGPEHPNTVISMNNLAHAFWKQEDFAAARQLEEQALSVRRRVLGDDHPDTLASMHNLACTLWKMGDSNDALAYWKMALEGLARVLGPTHRMTEAVRKRYSEALAEGH